MDKFSPLKTSQLINRALEMRAVSIACGLGLFAFLVRVGFLLISDNYDGDAYARMSLSRKVAHGDWLPTDVWLPSHFWILGTFCKMGISSQFGLRMVTAGAGALTVVLLFYLVRRFYDQERALLACLVLCLNPLHIRFSILTVSEAFFVLLLTAGLLAFDRYQERGTVAVLALGGAAMNLACGMRLEGWLFLPALLVWPLFKDGEGVRRVRLLRACWFVSLSSLFPLAWMIISLRTHGDPLHVATLTRETNVANLSYQSTSLLYRLCFWPALLVAALGPMLWPSLAGAARTLWGGRRFFGLLFVAFLGIYYVQNLRSAMITQARYGLLLVWILVLGLGEYFWKQKRILGTRRAALITVTWLLAVWGISTASLGFVSEKLSSVSPCPRFETDVRLVDQWLRGRGPAIQLFIGPLTDQYEPWMSSFDEWYQVDDVRVIRSLEELRDSLGSQTRSGYWVSDKAWLQQEGWDITPLIRSGVLRQEFAAGDYVVYGWEKNGITAVGSKHSQHSESIFCPRPRTLSLRLSLPTLQMSRARSEASYRGYRFA